MCADDFSDGIWLVDFEFHPESGLEGNPPSVVCMVAKRWPDGPTLRIWKDELLQTNTAPFPTGEGALFVAYFVCAEMDCFQQLGWSMPSNLLDLYSEFRLLTNGIPPVNPFILKSKSAGCNTPPIYPFQNKKACYYQRDPSYQVPISQPSPYRYYRSTVFSSNHFCF